MPDNEVTPMPDWARRRGISGSEWEQYAKWVKGTYGWRSFAQQNSPSIYNRYQLILKAGATIGPAPSKGGGLPVVSTTPVDTGTEDTATTGLPSDAELMAPGLYFSKSTGKYYDDLYNVVSQSYATQILNDFLNKPPSEQQKALEQARIQQETVRLQNLYNRRPEFGGADTREADFESYRQRMLGVLTGPQDWIERWSLQNAKNPYEKKELDERQQIKADIKRTSESKAYWARIAANYPEAAEVAQFGMEVADKNLKMHQKLNEKFAKAKEQAELIRAEMRETGVPQSLPRGQGGMDVGQAKALAAKRAYESALKTPEWLAPFTGGQVAGEPLTKEDIPTPSAQMWGRTPESKRLGLQGYTKWAGGETLADKLDRMQTMLPNAPSGGFRWRA